MPAPFPRALAALLVVLLAGCATSPGRSVPQLVRVETPGCPGAVCTLANDLGLWRIEPTPGDAEVMTSEKPLEVACRAEGGASVGASELGLPLELRSVSPASGIAGAAVGAGAAGAAVAPLVATPFAPLAGAFVLFGAVMGAGVGRAVDSTARAWAYPASVQVTLHCEPLSADRGALAAAPFGMAVRSAPAGERAAAGAVIVVAVAPQGRAAASGLEAGDRILKAAGAVAADSAALEEILEGVRGRTSVPLEVWRAGRTLTLELAVPGTAR